jgi:opacity protein-like surface antigen
MRRVLSAFFLLSALAVATPAAAQQDAGWFGSVGVGGGWGDLGSWSGKLENLTAGARGGYQLNKMFAVVGEVGSILHAEGCTQPAGIPNCTADNAQGLVSTNFSEIAAVAAARAGTVHINGTHIDGDIMIAPSVKVSKWFKPYVVGGFTYWMANAVRETDTGLVHNHIERNPGFNVGGGMYIPVYKFININADYRFFAINAESDNTNINQFTIQIGLIGHVVK